MPDIVLNGIPLKRYGIVSSVDYGTVEAETTYIDIPGSQTGTLDMSEADGYIKYKNRQVKIVVGKLKKREEWKIIESNFIGKFAGKRCTIESSDYPGKYMKGRIESIKPTYDHRIRYITVSINAEPWWYNSQETAVQETISGSGQIVLKNAKKPVVPKITGQEGMKITMGDDTVSLKGTGEEEYLEICLEEGENILAIEGTGTVKFTYTEAQL